MEATNDDISDMAIDEEAAAEDAAAASSEDTAVLLGLKEKVVLPTEVGDGVSNGDGGKTVGGGQLMEMELPMAMVGVL